jgi:hypothetical protein
MGREPGVEGLPVIEDGKSSSGGCGGFDIGDMGEGEVTLTCSNDSSSPSSLALIEPIDAVRRDVDPSDAIRCTTS